MSEWGFSVIAHIFRNYKQSTRSDMFQISNEYVGMGHNQYQLL